MVSTAFGRTIRGGVGDPLKAFIVWLGGVSVGVFILASVASAAVGRLPGVFNVSRTGGAQYAVPINVAAGINGLRPSVGLAYDSQGSDGVAGMGWNLAGFSTIHRCDKTIATNGARKGVRYEADDQFCLDGQPLVLAADSPTGTYGADGAVYRTEIDQYARVRSVGSLNGGPQWFAVQYRDGLTAYFGVTSNSRFAVTVGSNTYTRAWAVDQIQDKFFNSIRFEYYSGSGGYNFEPKEVRWTDHCSSAGCAEGSASGTRYKLIFEYEDRPDEAVRSGHVFGGSWTRSKRLVRIDYRYAATSSATFATVQDYQLTYKTPVSGGTERSQLQDVTLCGATHSDCMPATSLQWQNGTSGVNAAVYAGSYYADFYAFGDWDGDGRTDIYYPSTSSPYNLRIARSLGNGLFNDFATTLAFPFGQQLLGDFNGDGRTDILYSPGPTSNWQIRRATGNTSSPFVTESTGLPGPSAAGGVSVPAIGDFNGDGMADIAYQRVGVVYLRLNNGSNFGGTTPSAEVQATGLLDASSGWSWPVPDGALSPADFDGDGRTDLLVKYTSGPTQVWCMYRYQPEGAGVDWISDACTGNADNAFPLDVNGDGLTDLAYYSRSAPVGWYTLTSTGSGWEAPVFSGATDPLPERAVAIDYNGDGRDDLLHRNDGSVVSTGFSFVIHLSVGSGYENTVDRVVPFNLAYSPGLLRLAAVDFSGDGLQDLFYATSQSYQGAMAVYIRAGKRGDLLTQVTDGLGNVQKQIDYGPISSSSYYLGVNTTGYEGIIFPSAPENRPVLGSALHVLKSYVTNDGVGGEYTVGYKYRTGFLNIRGRGFLGFARVHTTDSRTGQPEQAVTRQLVFPRTGLVLSDHTCFDGTSCENTTPRTSTLRFSGGSYHVRSQTYGSSQPKYWQIGVNSAYAYDYDPDDGSTVVRFTSRLNSSAEWDFDLGSPLKETITVRPNNSGTPVFTREVNYGYGDTTLAGAAVWCLGLPTSVSEKQTKPDGTNATRTLTRTYFGNCRPQTTTVGAGGTDAQKQLVQTQAWNAYGNQSSLTESAGTTGTDAVSGNPLVSRYTSYEYMADVNGLGAEYQRTKMRRQIAAATTDACGNPIPAVTRDTLYTWDYRLGLIASERQATGEKVSWNYDAFGRLSDEDESAGVASPTVLRATDVAYTACGTCFPGSNAAFKVRRSRSDGYWSEGYFDSMGRQVGTASVLIDGRETRQAWLFDARGRLDEQDVPYTVAPGTGTSIAPFTSLLTFDVANRLTQRVDTVSVPTNQTAVTAYDYSGLSVTVTDAENRQRTLTSDLVGNLISVSEENPAGDSLTEYTYTPFQELSKITDAGNGLGVRAESTFGYDSRGFLTSRSDSDRGNWSFDYDPWGNVELESHGRGSTKYEYDALGQLRNRVDKLVATPELTTSWTYRNDGLLQGTSTGGYHAESLSYTDQAQVQSSTVWVLQGATNVAYNTTYSYDGYGRLETILYPQSVVGVRFKALYAYSTTGYAAGVYQDLGSPGSNPPLYNIGDASGGSQAATDAFGRIRRGYYGLATTGPRETYTYDDASTRLVAIQTTQSGGGTSLLQNYAYGWDKVGNLKTREDQLQGASQSSSWVKETFTYDPLNRLDLVQRSVGGGALTTTMDLSYHPNGNIATKAYTSSGSAAVFNYGLAGSGAGPHALSGITAGASVPGGAFHYDTVGNLDCRAWSGSACAMNSGITWWSFNLPQRINDPVGGGSYTDFAYGPNRERVRETHVRAASPAINRTTYRVGELFEIEADNGTVSRYRSNVYFAGRLVYSQLDIPGATPDVQQFYVHQDYQGSIDRVSFAGGTNPGGDEERYSFDAFGKRRNLDWTNNTTDSQFDANHWIDQGYTGHDHLDPVRLIHMNGRVQSPIWGRMLSPDPVVGDLTLPQSVNPYSYVMNNPGRYTDPTGFSHDDDGGSWDFGFCWYSYSYCGGGGVVTIVIDYRPFLLQQYNFAREAAALKDVAGTYIIETVKEALEPIGEVLGTPLTEPFTRPNFSDPFEAAAMAEYGVPLSRQEPLTVGEAVGLATTVGGVVSGPIRGITAARTAAGTLGASGATKTVTQATEGIYEFTAASGRTYVGQSGNIPARIQQHIASGKLPPGNAVTTREVLGGKTAREVAEQRRIDELGGIQNLENVRNPIGPKRRALMEAVGE